MKRITLLLGLLAANGACGNATSGDSTSQGGSAPGAGTGGSITSGGTHGVAASGGTGTGGAAASGLGGTSSIAGATASGGTTGGTQPVAGGGGSLSAGGSSAGGNGGTAVGTGGAAMGGGAPVAGSGGVALGGAGSSAGGQSGSASGGKAGASGGKAGASGSAGAGGVLTSSCVGGKAWTTADPTSAGPFQVTADKNVGPLAGYLPDPIYGDQQQHFNVYRPSNLKDSGYCHPILVWANGHGDNPEQNPPDCIIDSGANRWCGTYPVLINQLASHGFVVIASLSTTTSKGDPLPTITGLNWLLDQAEDPTSPYYHRLDTSRIGALGHSEGGLSTCKAAADPRISVIATVSGSATPTGLKGPALFICGGADTVVSCDSVKTTYQSVTAQESMWMDNLSADHGGWLYQNGTKGPDIFALTAWFRVHLMDDTANRAYFYGSSCKLCTDSRVKVERNSLMTMTP